MSVNGEAFSKVDLSFIEEIDETDTLGFRALSTDVLLFEHEAAHSLLTQPSIISRELFTISNTLGLFAYVSDKGVHISSLTLAHKHLQKPSSNQSLYCYDTKSITPNMIKFSEDGMFLMIALQKELIIIEMIIPDKFEKTLYFNIHKHTLEQDIFEFDASKPSKLFIVTSDERCIYLDYSNLSDLKCTTLKCIDKVSTVSSNSKVIHQSRLLVGTKNGCICLVDFKSDQLLAKCQINEQENQQIYSLNWFDDEHACCSLVDNSSFLEFCIFTLDTENYNQSFVTNLVNSDTFYANEGREDPSCRIHSYYLSHWKVLLATSSSDFKIALFTKNSVNNNFELAPLKLPVDTFPRHDEKDAFPIGFDIDLCYTKTVPNIREKSEEDHPPPPLVHVYLTSGEHVIYYLAKFGETTAYPNDYKNDKVNIEQISELIPFEEKPKPVMTLTQPPLNQTVKTDEVEPTAVPSINNIPKMATTTPFMQSQQPSLGGTSMGMNNVPLPSSKTFSQQPSAPFMEKPHTKFPTTAMNEPSQQQKQQIPSSLKTNEVTTKYEPSQPISLKTSQQPLLPSKLPKSKPIPSLKKPQHTPKSKATKHVLSSQLVSSRPSIQLQQAPKRNISKDLKSTLSEYENNVKKDLTRIKSKASTSQIDKKILEFINRMIEDSHSKMKRFQSLIANISAIEEHADNDYNFTSEDLRVMKSNLENISKNLIKKDDYHTLSQKVSQLLDKHVKERALASFLDLEVKSRMTLNNSSQQQLNGSRTFSCTQHKAHAVMARGLDENAQTLKDMIDQKYSNVLLNIDNLQQVILKKKHVPMKKLPTLLCLQDTLNIQRAKAIECRERVLQLLEKRRKLSIHFTTPHEQQGNHMNSSLMMAVAKKTRRHHALLSRPSTSTSTSRFDRLKQLLNQRKADTNVKPMQEEEAEEENEEEDSDEEDNEEEVDFSEDRIEKSQRDDAMRKISNGTTPFIPPTSSSLHKDFMKTTTLPPSQKPLFGVITAPQPSMLNATSTTPPITTAGVKQPTAMSTTMGTTTTTTTTPINNNAIQPNMLASKPSSSFSNMPFTSSNTMTSTGGAIPFNFGKDKTQPVSMSNNSTLSDTTSTTLTRPQQTKPVTMATSSESSQGNSVGLQSTSTTSLPTDTKKDEKNSQSAESTTGVTTSTTSSSGSSSTLPKPFTSSIAVPTSAATAISATSTPSAATTNTTNTSSAATTNTTNTQSSLAQGTNNPFTFALNKSDTSTTPKDVSSIFPSSLSSWNTNSFAATTTPPSANSTIEKNTTNQIGSGKFFEAPPSSSTDSSKSMILGSTTSANKTGPIIIGLSNPTNDNTNTGTNNTSTTTTTTTAMTQPPLSSSSSSSTSMAKDTLSKTSEAIPSTTTSTTTNTSSIDVVNKEQESKASIDSISSNSANVINPNEKSSSAGQSESLQPTLKIGGEKKEDTSTTTTPSTVPTSSATTAHPTAVQGTITSGIGIGTGSSSTPLSSSTTTPMTQSNTTTTTTTTTPTTTASPFPTTSMTGLAPTLPLSKAATSSSLQQAATTSKVQDENDMDEDMSGGDVGGLNSLSLGGNSSVSTTTSLPFNTSSFSNTMSGFNMGSSQQQAKSSISSAFPTSTSSSSNPSSSMTSSGSSFFEPPSTQNAPFSNPSISNTPFSFTSSNNSFGSGGTFSFNSGRNTTGGQGGFGSGSFANTTTSSFQSDTSKTGGAAFGQSGFGSKSVMGGTSAQPSAMPATVGGFGQTTGGFTTFSNPPSGSSAFSALSSNSNTGSSPFSTMINTSSSTPSFLQSQTTSNPSLFTSNTGTGGSSTGFGSGTFGTFGSFGHSFQQ
ncbi:hypothetical protein C9374_004273 [Naegleria lovaniensis]|uniref:Uncharacterized protein n=1 Tax=Naegleria lovaniensis TaxID=51637 RepID=A0AA88GSL5_NAELO|nr:uncharacterized protein C9374_004273 [Naegleria lovaniensis]KAG2383602.1 hypothetical protein C9374_004273 [Naegleria lovaniensis]